MSDYKNTLNLPQTDFPMKANLSQREPDMLAFWDKIEIYKNLREAGKDREKFILHDGPPYANGRIHIGHALNKTLKDMVLKSKTLSGFDTPYVPGWDCHGLPIELNVEKQLAKNKKQVTPREFRELCREYATEQMQGQSEEFQRLGVFGDWDNPYTTMDFSFEAGVVRTLAKIINNGHLHRGSKPVHWCVACGSALAEAEVEYQDKTSPSIDVAFVATDGKQLLCRFADHLPEGKVIMPIWTTTPWTLPANQAVAVNPNLDYALVDAKDGRYFIFATALAEQAMQRYGIADFNIIDSVQGEAFEGITLKHPFLDRTAPVLLGDHVTIEAGTGNVHTAPAHGQDDYVICSREGIEVDNPVNAEGIFVEGTPFFAGEHVYKVADHVLEVLREHDALLHHEKIEHSYPHCWRHKTPLIFRATPQWFISMDKQGLRTKALAAIDQTQWSPEWAQARIADMIVKRPDWCISRQRLWGTPLTLFVHKDTDELHPNTPELMEKVAVLISESGIDVWHELQPETLLGDDAHNYRKVTDSLDVWFDSGASHACVLSQRQDLRWPADMYLEGSDQYRGWFQSSLLTATAIEGRAPYDIVLSHGFTVDSQGRKMSKSLGNVILPEKVWNTLGADILRLWAASVDYRGEASVSDEILKRTSEVYRRIRNTARFLLSNLFDFDANEHILPFDKMLALDRWAVDRAKKVQDEILTAYDQFQFHVVSQKLQNFCTVDMGSFYLDIIKDRQYTTQKDSQARRSAQTAMYHILDAMVRWFAPILSFTAEEIWQHMSNRDEASVFLSTWQLELPELTDNEPILPADWQQLMQVKEEVNRILEQARKEGEIGSGLAAEVDIYCEAYLYQILKKLKNELRFVMITSTADIHPETERDEKATKTEMPGVWVKVSASPHEKCERCWHRREDVGMSVEHPSLCGRCVENVEGAGEKRLYA
jgi:isoleucyl-tRNA synthetase